MAYLRSSRISNRYRPVPNTMGDLGIWPFSSKSDEEKARENLVNMNQAIDNFRRAHEIAVALYQAGQLPDKLRDKHVKMRDKINSKLVTIMNAVTPEEYLDIHNYLANVRADVGLGILPLVILGIAGIAALAALGGTAALLKDSFNHAKELELVASGKAPADILKKPESKGTIEKLLGFDPKLLLLVGGAIVVAPWVIPYVKRAIQSARKK